MKKWFWRRMGFAVGMGFSLGMCSGAMRAQMVTGREMPGYAETFGLAPDKLAKAWEIRETEVTIGNSHGANVLYPTEIPRITFSLKNKGQVPLKGKLKFEIIPYATSVPVGDVWTPHVSPLEKSIASVQTPISLGANETITVMQDIKFPARFGGYAVIAEIPGAGRAFAATFVRVLKPDVGRVFLPTYALDLPWPFEISEAVTTLFERLGVKGCRMGADYIVTNDKDFNERNREFYQHLAWAQKHDITVMLTIGAGNAPNPLGRPRPWLNPQNEMLDTKSDMAWLPEYDDDFTRWTEKTISQFGYPRGPVNAVELWNEPWEGISISGWGADSLRYREMYRHMALGVEAARKTGVQVLIGGACSSSNTRDKLFCDGSDEFLKWLDFVSIHYQPLGADPAIDKKWQTRTGGYGKVKVWDTESWVANSEDRIAAVIASMRAQGQERTAGIYGGNVFTPEIVFDNPRLGIAQAWSPAAALAATQKFIGQRPFKEILFKNGLPWVFVFNSEAKGGGNAQRPMPDADNGTLVVVGDLGLVYERNRTLFRDVTGLANAPKIAEVQAQLAALPASAREGERKPLENALSAAMVTSGATLTLSNDHGHFIGYDFYGNPLAAKNGEIVIPLNGSGYFLRTDNTRGSFARLLNAVKNAKITGYTPVSVAVKDFVVLPDHAPRLNLTLTNIYNRTLTGNLSIRLQNGVQSNVRIELQPHQSRTISVDANLTPNPENAYRLHLEFDAGNDGKSVHEETLHTNVIAHRKITIDGDLKDWEGVLPQMATASIGAGLTETAYKPFLNFGTKTPGGVATGYLAYDDDYFYFAAKVSDPTAYRGNVRFETRDDDAYFYPDTVFEVNQKTPGSQERKTLVWPAGVRHYSYRKDPDLPSGNGTDNVQIAFNVLPESEKAWDTHPAGTMPHFMCYADTDYEFALNEVAPEYGGGTEIWELSKPGAPHKHFYPRQPKSPLDGGAIKTGKLVMKRNGNTRFIEAALPWSVLPEVKAARDAHRPIKFSYRVNDNGGPAYELSAGRSVAKTGNPTFHNDWATHWANELEFGWE